MCRSWRRCGGVGWRLVSSVCRRRDNRPLNAGALCRCGGGAHMGLDLLDFTFRVEKAFQINVPRGAYERLPRRIPFEVTAGELHDWVAQLCAEQGVRLPPSSWNRVKKVLVDVTGKSPKLIRRES